MRSCAADAGPLSDPGAVQRPKARAPAATTTAPIPARVIRCRVIRGRMGRDAGVGFAMLWPAADEPGPSEDTAGGTMGPFGLSDRVPPGNTATFSAVVYCLGVSLCLLFLSIDHLSPQEYPPRTRCPEFQDSRAVVEVR